MHCKHQSVTVGQIQIKYRCQIAQLKEHLTLGGPCSNPSLVCHFFPIPLQLVPNQVNPSHGINPGDDDLQGQNSINGGGNCDSQASLNTGPR